VNEEKQNLSIDELLLPGASWYRMYKYLPALDPARTPKGPPPSKEVILAKKEKGEKLYEEIAQKHEQGTPNRFQTLAPYFFLSVLASRAGSS
jgi:hypothetical protein